MTDNSTQTNFICFECNELHGKVNNYKDLIDETNFKSEGIIEENE